MNGAFGKDAQASRKDQEHRHPWTLFNRIDGSLLSFPLTKEFLTKRHDIFHIMNVGMCRGLAILNARTEHNYMNASPVCLPLRSCFDASQRFILNRFLSDIPSRENVYMPYTQRLPVFRHLLRAQDHQEFNPRCLWSFLFSRIEQTHSLGASLF